MSEYNTTQLHPEHTFAKHVFHRDQFAHYFRWTHLMNRVKPQEATVLDFGCGNANLCEVLYRNQRRPKAYLGLDVRPRTIQSLKEKWKSIPWAQFETVDLVKPLDEIPGDQPWDFITCFEVLEHVGKKNAPLLLDNIRRCMTKDTILLLSTPNYDPRVGHADNHEINGEIGELTHEETKALLSERFEIVDKYGTFASIRDYKHLMTDWQEKMYEQLRRYYDSDLLSNIMAPFFPEQSRNTLWVCKVKP